MTDKEPPLILDKGEVACAPQKDPEHYEGENAKLPKKYTIQEVRQRQALKEYGNQIAGDTFKEGEDFKGYFSDQWESPLQQKLLQRVTTDYVDLHEQEELFKCELKPLDVEMDIMDDNTVVVIGKRRSGKSFWARWCMYHLRNRFPAGIVITSTKLNGFWSQYVPDKFIHDVESMEEVLEAVCARQTFLKKNSFMGIDSRFFVILDDVLKNPNIIKYSKGLQNLFANGRHYGIFLMVLLQDPKGIPPMLRENTDIAVVFRQFTQSRIDCCREIYLDFIEEKKMQREFLLKHTTKRNPDDGTPFDARKYIKEDVMPEIAKIRSTAPTKKSDDPPEKEEKLKEKIGKKIPKPVPEVLCCLTAETTDNLLDIFKISIAEDPGPFRLGDARYWMSLDTGKYLHLTKTFDEVSLIYLHIIVYFELISYITTSVDVLSVIFFFL